MELTFITETEDQTRMLAKTIASRLNPGDVIALVGELGSGKTVFVKGLHEGLGCDSNYPVTSPTYAIIHEYPGPIPLIHADLFRLKSVDELIQIGISEYLKGGMIMVVEWADAAENFWPDHTITISFKIYDRDERNIVMKVPNEAYPSRFNSLNFAG